jgi:hypothetical protein
MIRFGIADDGAGEKNWRGMDYAKNRNGHDRLRITR